jgi:hypothetical protein
VKNLSPLPECWAQIFTLLLSKVILKRKMTLSILSNDSHKTPNIFCDTSEVTKFSANQDKVKDYQIEKAKMREFGIQEVKELRER